MSMVLEFDIVRRQTSDGMTLDVNGTTRKTVSATESGRRHWHGRVPFSTNVGRNVVRFRHLNADSGTNRATRFNALTLRPASERAAQSTTSARRE